jgi:hypothetical protein
MVRVLVFIATFNNISVRYIMVVNFIGGGNRSTQRKPPPSCKSLSGVRIPKVSGDMH